MTRRPALGPGDPAGELTTQTGPVPKPQPGPFLSWRKDGLADRTGPAAIPIPDHRLTAPQPVTPNSHTRPSQRLNQACQCGIHHHPGVPKPHRHPGQQSRRADPLPKGLLGSARMVWLGRVAGAGPPTPLPHPPTASARGSMRHPPPPRGAKATSTSRPAEPPGRPIAQGAPEWRPNGLAGRTGLAPCRNGD
jgi:hypothetical protein